MAKKQVKVSPENFVKGRQYSFILSNQSVLLASLISTESGQIKVKNTKGHVLHLSLDQIDEIWDEEKVV